VFGWIKGILGYVLDSYGLMVGAEVLTRCLVNWAEGLLGIAPSIPENYDPVIGEGM
jgi:hypothetical protein